MGRKTSVLSEPLWSAVNAAFRGLWRGTPLRAFINPKLSLIDAYKLPCATRRIAARQQTPRSLFGNFRINRNRVFNLMFSSKEM